MANRTNLSFLESLLASIGVSKPELARLMKMSPQNIFAYFRRDDMRLSFAQEIVDRLGYVLSFSLEREAPSSMHVVEIELSQGTDTIDRLAFLRIAMQKYGIYLVILSFLYTFAPGLQKVDQGVLRVFAAEIIPSYLIRIMPA